MSLDRAYCAQLALVIFRPLAFVWSVSIIAPALWGDNYLVALGLIPIFSILDIAFQSRTRHRYLSGVDGAPVGGYFTHFGYFLVIVLLLTMIFGYRKESAPVMVAALFLLYTNSAIVNIYEDTFSSSEAVLNLAIYEISGFSLCLMVMIFEPLFAAVLVNFINPSCRVFIALRYSGRPRRSKGQAVVIRSKGAYVAASIFTQTFASFSAAAPALLVFLSLMPKEGVSSALIYFKFLFAGASLLSLSVNLFSGRLFYGVVRLNLISYKDLIKFCERAFLLCFVSAGIVWSLSLFFNVLPKISFAIWLCIGFSYLNLLSSLGLARGRPMLSAVAQSAILVGSFGFSAYLGGSFVVALFPIVLFVFMFLTIRGRQTVSSLLVE